VRCGLHRVEHGIRPLLANAVTIPIEKDGKEFVIYVSSIVNPFSPHSFTRYYDKELQDFAKKIADKLEIEPAE